jgi:hypothetical protein
MDNGTMRDYIADLILQVNDLQAQVRFWQATAEQAMENTDKAIAIIDLQNQHDQFRELYKAEYKKAMESPQ